MGRPLKYPDLLDDFASLSKDERLVIPLSDMPNVKSIRKARAAISNMLNHHFAEECHENGWSIHTQCYFLRDSVEIWYADARR